MSVYGPRAVLFTFIVEVFPQRLFAYFTAHFAKQDLRAIWGRYDFS